MMKYIRKNGWDYEWGFLTQYERMVFGLEFHFPTPKKKTFCLGLTLFTCSIFWIEISKCDEPIKPLNLFPNGKV